MNPPKPNIMGQWNSGTQEKKTGWNFQKKKNKKKGDEQVKKKKKQIYITYYVLCRIYLSES